MIPMSTAKAAQMLFGYLAAGLALVVGIVYFYPPPAGASLEQYITGLGVVRFLFLGIGFALVVLGPVGFLLQLAARKRLVKVQRVAVQMGFSFFPTTAGLADTAFLALPVFFERFYSSVDEVMQGRLLEADVILCRHYNSRDPETEIRYQTVACFRSPKERPIPSFVLRPQTLWGLVAAAWRDDISFASHPKFSAAYRMRGEDETAIRALFQPPLLDYFQQDQRWWCVESGHGWVAVYRPGDDVAIHNLPTFLEQTRRIFRLLSGVERPSFLPSES